MSRTFPLRPRERANTRCAVCHDESDVAGLRPCGACRTPFHADCSSACPILGCAGRLERSRPVRGALDPELGVRFAASPRWIPGWWELRRALSAARRTLAECRELALPSVFLGGYVALAVSTAGTRGDPWMCGLALVGLVAVGASGYLYLWSD